MRHRQLLVLLIMLLIGVGIALSQEETMPPPSFEVVSEIGRALPRSIIYEPTHERFAVINAYGELAFVDAQTYETEFMLYQSGDFNDFAFSHDGRYFALAIGNRIELWDVERQTIAAQLLDLNQAISIEGALTFSPNDELLLFNGIYPAPQSVRRSENDTSVVPWIWHLPTAREETETSPFPRGVEAWAFYDYRNGFVLGPENRIVAALPGRLHVLDALTLDVLYEIDTFRYEPDPLTVYFSAKDNTIYVGQVYEPGLFQVDTQRGVLVEIPLERWLSQADLELVGGVELGETAQVIGDAASRGYNPLLGVFLGQNYRDSSAFGSAPLTVTLIDVVIPPAGQYDRVQLFLFIYDEGQRRGYFTLTYPYDTQQMALSPDGTRLAIRRTLSEEQVELYDIASGEMQLSVIPAVRGEGYYYWVQKNRVLAWTADGTHFLSDFERFESQTGDIVAQDHRYSRRFERFFWSEDNATIVTLSGTEWRLWDVQTGEVLRREVLPLNGSIVATSSDGWRYLTAFYTASGEEGRATYDVATGEAYDVTFTTLPGRDIQEVYAAPDWQHFFVIYTPNIWGPYYPGNEIALYDLREDEQLWFIAGGELPPPADRLYGWVDNDQVYVYGASTGIVQIGAPNGGSGGQMPACVMDAFGYTEADRQYADEDWAFYIDGLTDDQIVDLITELCGEEAALSFDQTATPAPSRTPSPVADIPECVRLRYPYRADELAAMWSELTDGLTQAQINEQVALLCEGVGPPTPQMDGAPVVTTLQTMFIDVETGERSLGDYTPPPSRTRPLQPIIDEYYRTARRQMGTIALSPDNTLIAASSLPGELVIYRFTDRINYATLVSYGTATRSAELNAANLISVLPSATPTLSTIGTAQPTFTPTITPTPPPRPEQGLDLPQEGESEDFCPSEELFTLADAPEEFNPTGRIIGRASGDYLWAAQPEDGSRAPDLTVPACGPQFRCDIAPDESWFLAYAINEIFVVRPDGTDVRTLFDEDDIWPDQIEWSGANTLEYEVYVYREQSPVGQAGYHIQRDILGVFPDPIPWYPLVQIPDEEAFDPNAPAEIIVRQPGGAWLVVRTIFTTGVGPGYKYYLYNIDTGEYTYFARLAGYPAQSMYFEWDDLGQRLFYAYPQRSGEYREFYVFDPATGEHQLLGDFYGGVWSQDGRYAAFATNRRTQPVAVWDSQTGLLRTYCIPETGARLYEGSFTWSPIDQPDGRRYLALLAPLPRDESDEGIGAHTLILDIETGVVVDLVTGLADHLIWLVDAPPGALPFGAPTATPSAP